MGTAGDPEYLSLDDGLLLGQCRMERFRASGPGGQHRNKTDSGVRLRHEPTGLVAQATERRSQHENRAVALKRLRVLIALEVRSAVEMERYEVPGELRAILPGAGQRRGTRHPDFWQGVQRLLDLFVGRGCSVAETAAALGVSTGQLSRILTGEAQLLVKVNLLRAERGIGPLRPS